MAKVFPQLESGQTDFVEAQDIVFVGTAAGDRDALNKWAEDRDAEGVKTYWSERNQSTINDMPTNILGEINET